MLILQSYSKNSLINKFIALLFTYFTCARKIEKLKLIIFLEMSLVNVLNVDVLNNPAKFTDPFQFEITFECLADNLENGISTFAN